jgi:hypothetical protein
MRDAGRLFIGNYSEKKANNAKEAKKDYEPGTMDWVFKSKS